jgi:hypothetical protein
MTSLMVNWTTTKAEAEHWATSWSSGGGSSSMVMMAWSSGGSSSMVMMASHCDCWFVWFFGEWFGLLKLNLF